MAENNIENIRHSLSHVLAAAVLDMFPEAKLGIGPAIDNGFYYDFELPRTLIPEDLPLLEEKMRKFISEDYDFQQSDLPSNEAMEQFNNVGQVYKAELVKDLIAKGEQKVSFYKVNGFIDLCAGPHVNSTKDLRNTGFKLDKIAGAYWRGSEKNPMLQRIYGLAFEDKASLENYLKQREEAEKRDHKKLGKEMDLFSFHPEAPGMPFWHEKGMRLWSALEGYGKSIRKKYGFIEIKTPLLAKNTLWITSGHWDHYKDGMFTFEDNGDVYGLKPMDCPFNVLIYKTRQRSYRDLPIRYTEIGKVHRREQSGELNGLLRVQEITQDDSHLFVREDQIGDEIKNLLRMVKEYYSHLGLVPKYYLSTRPEDYMGEIATWDKAEADLRRVLEEEKIEYQVKEKDGAFYGPKIDVDIKDALGRDWQVATIQLDFQLPQRFGCEYIAENGERKTPVIIHAAIFGSFERMIGILIEHYGGAFPLWLAPVQAIVLPIADRHAEYAAKVVGQLAEANIRAELDDRSESVGRKIRESELQKIPYMLIVGDKEIEAGKVAVRRYGEGDKGQMDVADIIKDIKA